ncbi:Na+/H+ antiporter NhaD/arsenite permease-like protein [Nocardioides luteus]|uniref:Membrane protein n=1 Tax=Nocardioides luteus TaxID=1844 RepID=A0ABQ5SRF1_9ACTN|nr:ArsB/NhaD family transporter [Nocardioides luteus]MDR7311187.1 Na+/H+ antiporter NhaD/arsenite permease-like protein [Nocardioides luteus]GGR62896.1 membrane protein [Nocardioides luteus]GLJ66733.1 membrane protein [Nocardioides luteus]
MILTAAALSIFLVSYALIATERVHRVAAALGGVAAMTVIGLVDADTAFTNPHTGIDWNVIFLLFGMMVIVGVLKQTGLFEFLALWAARTSGGRPYLLLVLLVLVTAAVAPILDNVTCVLLVAPVTLSVCRQLGLSPMPYLVSLILTANLTGPSTLIADPPNIIIASRAELTFNDFLVHSLPLTLILLVAYLLFARLLFWRHLRTTVDVEKVVGHMHPRDAITNMRLLVRCLIVLALVMLAFGLHTVLHLDPAVVAMLGAGATVLVSRTTPEEFLEEVEWATLAFFMALFVLVGSLVEVGIIGEVGRVAAQWMGDRELLGATALLFGSGVFGAFVDNIPYTTAMVPVVEDMVAVTPQAGAESPLWWAFVWGADLGGNATAVAAGANVVVLGIAAKNGQPISFWGFTKYGLVVTAGSLAIAWVYLYLRYFALA